MIRFIDLQDQINPDENHRFAFYNTTTDEFEKFNHENTWESVEDFKLDYKGSPLQLERYLNLIPDYWPGCPCNHTEPDIITGLPKCTQCGGIKID